MYDLIAFAGLRRPGSQGAAVLTVRRADGSHLTLARRSFPRAPKAGTGKRSLMGNKTVQQSFIFHPSEITEEKVE